MDKTQGDNLKVFPGEGQALIFIYRFSFENSNLAPFAPLRELKHSPGMRPLGPISIQRDDLWPRIPEAASLIFHRKGVFAGR
jgi:hypothetical protein